MRDDHPWAGAASDTREQLTRTGLREDQAAAALAALADGRRGPRLAFSPQAWRTFAKEAKIERR